MSSIKIENKISKVVFKFETEIIGKKPKKIKTIINENTIIIRMKGFLSSSEIKLAQSTSGSELIKNYRTMIFEHETDTFRKMIEDVIPASIINLYSDVDTRTGEKIIIISLNKIIDNSLSE
ncbi:MAG: Na-translocating system protein MpsC family protein [Halothermotrichaceae bacterium]